MYAVWLHGHWVQTPRPIEATCLENLSCGQARLRCYPQRIRFQAGDEDVRLRLAHPHRIVSVLSLGCAASIGRGSAPCICATRLHTENDAYISSHVSFPVTCFIRLCYERVLSFHFIQLLGT